MLPLPCVTPAWARPSPCAKTRWLIFLIATAFQANTTLPTSRCGTRRSSPAFPKNKRSPSFQFSEIGSVTAERLAALFWKRENGSTLVRVPNISICIEMRQHLPAEFNAALYSWEQSYFFENCLGRYFQIEPARLERLAALPALSEIAQRLAQLPRVLVHRDFQSQNILVRNGQAYLIDFQGMRPGLAQYDLASLLYDPYVELTQAEHDELLEYYCSEKPSPDFLETLRLCAMQRLMQALGAYGFLGLVKDYKHFLQHIPRTVQSLREVVGKIDGLELFEKFLAELP